MSTNRTKGIIRTLVVCLIASTIAAILKVVYGVATNTLAFIADGIHSFFDSGATVLGILSVLWAGKPADDRHPYGYQKLETLAAIILAAFLLVAAFEVGELAIHRLVAPEEPLKHFSIYGWIILGTTMVINLGIAYFEKIQAKKYNSAFLEADSLHNQSDFLITCAVVVSLISIQMQWQYVDAFVCLTIAFYLVYLSIRLIKMNVSPLIDARVIDPADIEKTAMEVKGVIHCHAIRSRGDQGHQYVDLNIHLSGDISLSEAHEITHRVEGRIKKRFSSVVDVVIHTEPEGHKDCSEYRDLF